MDRNYDWLRLRLTNVQSTIYWWVFGSGRYFRTSIKEHMLPGTQIHKNMVWPHGRHQRKSKMYLLETVEKNEWFIASKNIYIFQNWRYYYSRNSILKEYQSTSTSKICCILCWEFVLLISDALDDRSGESEVVGWCH